jgi:hypothetical protein
MFAGEQSANYRYVERFAAIELLGVGQGSLRFMFIVRCASLV